MSKLKLPPPIVSSDRSSFAYKSFSERYPKIIDNVISQNCYPPSINKNLQLLKRELTEKESVKPLASSQPDGVQWNGELCSFSSCTWFGLPFFFAEAFFFRRLLEAIHYFDYGPRQGCDPFQTVKNEQLTKDIRQFGKVIQNSMAFPPEQQCNTLIFYYLWGNYVDLSNFFTEFANLVNDKSQEELLLIDDTRKITQFLSQGVKSISYITDNIGIELLFDLRLIDFLLTTGWTDSIVIHLKDRPFFISDAMPKDLLASVYKLKEMLDPQLQEMALRLEKYISTNKIQLKVHPLWTSGSTFYKARVIFNKELENSDLIILKGDLNYRRLLGDFRWHPSTKINEIANYSQSPVVLLRTLKSELIVGLSRDQINRLNDDDPQWMTNGKRGIVQFLSG